MTTEVDYKKSLPMSITDFTDTTIGNTVLPPSTHVEATDTAVVVALSPNGNEVSVSNFPPFSGVSSPLILNVPMPTANTEYTISLPQNTKRILFRMRNSSKCQFSYVVSQSFTNYITINPGVVYQEGELNLSSPLVIYVQSSKPLEVAEVLYWV